LVGPTAPTDFSHSILFVLYEAEQTERLMWRSQPSVILCGQVSVTKPPVCRLLYKYRPAFLYRTLTINPEFLTVRLLTAVAYKMARRNFYRHLSISPPFYIQFYTENLDAMRAAAVSSGYIDVLEGSRGNEVLVAISTFFVRLR
jgi:hypothetical protein